MHRSHLHLTLFLLLAAFTVAGCGDNMISENSPASAADQHVAKASTSDGVLINGFIVTLTGYNFDGTSTTFSYNVLGPGDGSNGNDDTDALSHFTIELPDCAPSLSGFTPTNSVSINNNPQTGIYGIEWHLSVQQGGNADYSITFPGLVKQGLVLLSVKAGNVWKVAEGPGPCANLFDISGRVFADGDVNGSQDNTGTPLTDVTIELLDTNDAVIRTTKSQADGSYLLEDQVKGSYSVHLPDVTVAADFNEQLFDNFTYTGASPDLKLPVVIGPNSTGNDFGFDAKTQKVIDDLSLGAYSYNAQPVRFWIRQAKVAATGNGNADIAPADFAALLDEIEGLYLPVPFEFDDANEAQAAHDILKSNSKDQVDILLKELLATELNLFHFGEFSNATGLMPALVAWGESVAANELNAAAAKAAAPTPGPLDDAIELFNTLNSSGGGGGVD